jgi:hypothetical protein
MTNIFEKTNNGQIETENDFKNKYLEQADNEGYVAIGAFAVSELKRQAKNVASLLDGEEGTEQDYFLGENLRYKGNSGNYSDMKIHIDDLDEFIKRVKKHYEQ